MSASVSASRWFAALVVLLSLATPAAAQDRLCDPAERDELGRDCRDILISHIRQEKVGLDVAFWFMEDSWIAAEVINRKDAGVPVRVLMDTRANASTPRNATRLAELQAAGIPMREKVSSGILHWKMMLFAGQDIVQFSGANYSPDAWTVSGDEYTNYTDEAIYFTSRPSIVNSFRTKYDDLWVDTTGYRDYANITGPLTRVYDRYAIDPELNFVPSESHAVRSVAAYGEETRKSDVTMYRITDARYADAMIAAVDRGVPVRLLTEPKQYRDPLRQYHSWNIDRMYMAGVEIRDRAHAGLNHQKTVLLYDRGTSIFGSSNWSSASSESQEEHNLFTQDPWAFQWLVDQFERKWNNATGLMETAPFTPLPPGQATAPFPADQAAAVDPWTSRLGWSGGYWAHGYDVYLGTAPSAMTLVAANVDRATSGVDDNGLALTPPLVSGTTYYWRVVSRTMANRVSESPVWSFTTAGMAPAPTPAAQVTLAREPYLQQVSDTGGVVVWATRETGTAVVRLTMPTGSVETLAATSTHYPASETGLTSDFYQHAVRLTSLTPATTYSYDILVNDVDLNPGVDTVTTAPARGTGAVTFVAFGDSGTGSSGQQQVAALLEQDRFDFAMHGGDIAYANTSGTGPASYQTMDEWFFAPYRNWLRHRPMFPSMGNHDSRATNADGRPYLGLFELPTHAATSTYPDHAERYYSFDYGPLHVIVLDTEFAFQDPARRAAQIAWADADLSATTQPWKIALYHRSAYSAGGENGSELPVREAFGPLFDRHGVHLALSAHEHDYERTHPLTAGVRETGGTVYVVSGGGGGPLYPSGYADWTAHSASVHHYVRGTATECTLTLSAIGVSGAAFDTLSLQRCEPAPDGTAPQVSVTSPAPGSTVRGTVGVAVTASDNVGVAGVELLVDGLVVATDTQAPYAFSWDSTAVTGGAHSLSARALDAAGNTAVSAAVDVTVDNTSAGDGEIVLYAADAPVLAGNWTIQDDVTAAGGRVIRNPDRGAAKRTVALAAPTDYVEITFDARADVPYRLWMRGRADGDVYMNDSVFVQFSAATAFAIGTTSATEYNLEECSGCRISGWGWQDNGWGDGVLGPTITFTTTGPQTMRIQTREDGLSIDQIILSPSRFLTTSPGALKNDTSIYPRSSETSPGTEPEPTSTPPNTAPAVTLTSPSGGSTFTAPAEISMTASPSDSDGTVTGVEFHAGSALVGSATASPYTVTWSHVAAGTYTLTAKAIDDDGAVTTSAPVTVTVGEPPSPSALPTPWSAQDIGESGAFGTATASDGMFTIEGAGADIWSSADAFHYMWQPLRGDGDVIARVTSIEYVHAWVKAGVMIRERLTADSAHAFMLVSAGKGLAFQRRLVTGGSSVSTSGGSGTAPAWVKLERRGDTITAFRSADGTVWTTIGAATFTMAAEVYVGLAVSSHVSGNLATVTVDNVSVTAGGTVHPAPPPNVAPSVSLTSPSTGASFTAPASLTIAASAADSDGGIARVEFYAGEALLGSSSAAPYSMTWSNVPAGSYTLTARAIDDQGAAARSAPVTVTVNDAPPPALPVPWTAQDIGTTGAPGSATVSAGTFAIEGAGADIWNTADAFQYVWQPLQGDGDVIARVTSVESVHAWVKAGVMIREHLTPGSAHGLMLVSAGKGLAFQRRTATGGVSTHTGGGSGTVPVWVKLERRGSIITAYRSSDGGTWTLVGSEHLPMAFEVYVGLAVSSHVAGDLATATFDQVSVSPR